MKRESRVIAITGVQGSGKTFRVHELAEQERREGKSVYIVEEIARKCKYKMGTIFAQEYIFYAQIKQENWAFRQKVDTVVLDRMALDNLMYYYYILDQIPDSDDSLPKKWDRWQELYRIALTQIPLYDEIIRLPLNLERLKNDDPIRPKSEAYAKRIDALFDRFLPLSASEPKD